MISSLELAKICGVSQGTVDRALHNRPDINARTKKRILRAAKHYGYHPNPAVVEILQGQTNFVGAAVPALNSIFFMDLVAEIDHALDRIGLRLLLTPTRDVPELLRVTNDFAARRSRAMIIIPPKDNVVIQRSTTRNMPVISLVSPAKGRNVHFVAPNEIRTGKNAVRFLVRKGHRCILHLTYGRKAKAIVDRAQGYKREMKKNRLPAKVLVFESDRQLMTAVRKYRATALFCHNDWLALKAIRILQAYGMAVPKDVSVMGVDNSPSFVSLYPGVATMDYPRTSIAQHVVNLISGKTACPKINDLIIVDRNTVRTLGLRTY